MQISRIQFPFMCMSMKLLLDGEDFSPINANGKWNRSESAFIAEADPNTYITAECGNSIFDSDPDN